MKVFKYSSLEINKNIQYSGSKNLLFHLSTLIWNEAYLFESAKVFIAGVLPVHSGLELAKNPKTPITSTALICTLYKLQGSFIILLGVYCDKIFWWNPVEHLFFVVERFQY